MKPLASRMQWGLVGAGYASVFVFSAAALYQRHLVELQDPVAASGGMAAFGDTILGLFLGCLFLVPSALLIWIMAKSEPLYVKYAQFLLGLSLTAPVCLCGILFGGNYLAEGLSGVCFFRILGSPLILMGMGVSRLVAHFDRAKRLTTYALLVEGLTIGLTVAAFVVAAIIHR